VQTAIHKLTVTAIAFSALAITTTGAFATSIPLGGGGVLNLSNMPGTVVGVSNICINWSGTAGPCTPTSVQDSVSGTDPIFVSGSTAQDTIKNLPAGVVTPLVAFETVQSTLPGGIVTFDLTSIVLPGAAGNCATDVFCRPGGASPFTFVQDTANQVTVSFAVTLLGYTGTSASGSTVYNGVFTTQLSGNLPNGAVVNIPNILAYEAGGGNITSTWSASESPVAPTTVPEPMSSLLLGSGLLGLSLFGRRYRRS